MTHILKTWPEFFKYILSGEKTFEFRKNDRKFKVKDILHLLEYNPEEKSYTGRYVDAEVSYILKGFQGIEDDYVIMAIQVIGIGREEVE